MADSGNRLNIQLDERYASKLRALAERTHVNPGTLARSLLSTALAIAETDPGAHAPAESGEVTLSRATGIRA